jgi:ferredoxin/flavodoxin---NADP+ reductase
VSENYDLIVVGGGLAGWSLISQARRGGLKKVALIDIAAGKTPQGAAVPGVDIKPGVELLKIHSGAGATDITIDLESESLVSEVVVIDVTSGQMTLPSFPSIPSDLEQRVRTRIDFDPTDQDVLVLGPSGTVGQEVDRLSSAGARVVVALDADYSEISSLARQELESLEREQRATILWRARAADIWDSSGFPMVSFSDRRTPDLQFDYVVDLGRDLSTVADLGIRLVLEGTQKVYGISTHPLEEGSLEVISPGESWEAIRQSCFPDLPALRPRTQEILTRKQVLDLEAKHYNATITHFDTAHNELWRIRIRPDRDYIAHRAGQYCSLGLGYWEPRADDSVDPSLDTNISKLVRRSYSISHRIFDDYGYIADQRDMNEVELYIVWVQPDRDRVPALTPRLALKNVGDRIYFGPKVAGRYTLNPLTDPDSSVAFVATGTGEAPHNAMLVELLRKGHRGPIRSFVSVRKRADLAYQSEHRELEAIFPNYRYVPVPTREPDVPKLYMQDLLASGAMDGEMGRVLEPANTHVFLCGNPSMIGLPEWAETPIFPQPTGMLELLDQRGFTIDHRGVVGNVHYEEYW